MTPKKVIDLSVYSALDQYCIGLNEYYKSLRRSGFSVDHALYLITAPQTYPATILPQPNWLPETPEYYDEDEDD
tara:strand:- start:461 stop:682 length:222 start_codon:yes stop_codon:yes gene_type:complete